MIKNVYRSACKVQVIFVRFWCNWNFLDLFFSKKYSNVEYNQDPSSGNRIIPCGRTDRYDEANGRLPQTALTLAGSQHKITVWLKTATLIPAVA